MVGRALIWVGVTATIGLGSADMAAAAPLSPNVGAVRFSGADGQGGAFQLTLQLNGGDFTGMGSGEAGGFAFGGPAKGYLENGRCYVEVAGPETLGAPKSIRFSGRCDTATYAGTFETSGRGGRQAGDFTAQASAAITPAARLTVPTAKLTCAYQEAQGGGRYALRFSNMGSITLRPNGTYVAGTGVTGGWRREGDTVRLTSGAWKGYLARLGADRGGRPKLEFDSVDPAATTNCTQGR